MVAAFIFIVVCGWNSDNLLNFLLHVFCFGPSLFYSQKMSGIIT